jgi:hypothetical protein
MRIDELTNAKEGFLHNITKANIGFFVISSIIGYMILGPIAKVVLYLLSITGNNLLKLYIDTCVSESSRGSVDNLLYFLFLCFVMGVNFFFFDKTLEIKGKYKKIIKKISESEEKINGKEEIKTKDSKEELLELKKETLIEGKKSNQLTILIILLLLFSDLFALFLLSYNYTAQLLPLEFNRNIKILTPYISNTDVKKLESSWASMQRLEDYNAIVEKMNNFATKNNLTLRTMILYIPKPETKKQSLDKLVKFQ